MTEPTRSLADSVVARMRKQRDLLYAMNDESQSTSVEVSSQDQSVKVTVDAHGAMTGLKITSKGQRLGPDALAQRILETASAAAQLVLQRQQFVNAEFSQRFAALQQEPLRRWDGTMFQPEPPTV